jgi:hypothetical protein
VFFGKSGFFGFRGQKSGIPPVEKRDPPLVTCLVKNGKNGTFRDRQGFVLLDFLALSLEQNYRLILAKKVHVSRLDF